MIGEERVRLIDSSDWMHGIGRLNELVEWLAFGWPLIGAVSS